MSYYDDIYLKRLNRYGIDFQSRLQGQRERNFEIYLLRSLFRVDFEFEEKVHPASLERYKQDYSETQMHLLTRWDLNIPNGTILDIVNQDGTAAKWMIWWREEIESSGYNKYVVLRMTHQMTWTENGQEHSQWGFFRGPGKMAIIDTIRSPIHHTLYNENDHLHMFITPYNQYLKKENYFAIKEGETDQGFVITDVDINSTPGVEYVSVDPTFLRAPLSTPTEPRDTEFYWLDSGVTTNPENSEPVDPEGDNNGSP